MENTVPIKMNPIKGKVDDSVDKSGDDIRNKIDDGDVRNKKRQYQSKCHFHYKYSYTGLNPFSLNHLFFLTYK